MPWSDLSPMDQKMQLIADFKLGLFSVSELAARYALSRKTVYKWTARYDDLGPEGLLDRDRAPHTCPHRTPPEVVSAILDYHDRFGWGAKKLLKLLRTAPRLARPSLSNVHPSSTPRPRTPPPTSPPRHPGHPTSRSWRPTSPERNFKGHSNKRRRTATPGRHRQLFSYLLGFQDRTSISWPAISQSSKPSASTGCPPLRT